MKREITLVDRGRGLQLSSSRITVQDLVPYFQKGTPYAEIRRWIPTLSDDEISVVEDYYRAHRRELDEQDAVIRAHQEERRRQHYQRFPETSHEERVGRLRELLKERKKKEEESVARHPRG